MAREWAATDFSPPRGRYPIGIRLVLTPLYLANFPAWPALRLTQVACVGLLGLSITLALYRYTKPLQSGCLGGIAVLLTLLLDSGFHYLEIWVALFGSIGLGILLNSNSVRAFFGAGLAFGFAFQFKQFGLYYLVALLVWNGFASLKGQAIRPQLLKSVAATIGFLVPMTFLMWYFWAFGRLHDFVYYLFVEPVIRYHGDDTPLDVVQILRIVPLLGLVLLGLFPWHGALWSQEQRLLLLVAFLLPLMSLHKYVIGHYAIPAVPPCVFLGGPASVSLARGWSGLSRTGKRVIGVTMGILLFVIAVALSMRASLLQGIFTGSHKRHVMNLAADIAAYTNKGDLVYLDVSCPTHGSKLYALTDTVPAGLIPTFRYGDRSYYSAQHGRKLLEELKSGKVKLVVFDREQAYRGWTRTFYGDALDEIAAILERDFQPVSSTQGNWKNPPLVLKQGAGEKNYVTVNYWACTVTRRASRNDDPLQ